MFASNRLLVSFCVALVLVLPRTGSAQSALQTAGTLHTFVHHELTQLPTSALPNLALSGNGGIAVFALNDQPGRARVLAMSTASGTPVEVDNYEAWCYCDASLLAVSHDGGVIASSESMHLRVTTPSGGGRSLLETNSNEIRDLAVSGDGRFVFFQMRRDNSRRADGSPLERGVWVVGSEGSGLRQLVSPSQIAGLVGSTPDQVFPFDVVGYSLDASYDGQRIVFGVTVGGLGHYLVGVNLDGSGLHVIYGPTYWIYGAGLSANGSTVFFNQVSAYGAQTELYVAGFDGGGRRLLADSDEPYGTYPIGFAYVDNPISISADGRYVHMSPAGFRFDTVDGSTLQLALRGGSWSSEPPVILYDGLYQGVMDASGRKVLYLAGDDRGVRQLALLEVDPASLGAAPTISDLSATPPWILTLGRSNTLLRARVQASGTRYQVGAAFLRDGRNNWFDFSALPVLVDDGSSGDAVAGDGVYSTNQVWASTNPATLPGPRTVRIRSEARAANGLRHATAVEFEPLTLINSGVATEPGESVPGTFGLEPPYPNPTRSSAEFAWTQPEPGPVRLEIFDAAGRLVRRMVNETWPAGRHAVSISASDLSTGIYLVRLTGDRSADAKRLVVIR